MRRSTPHTFVHVCSAHIRWTCGPTCGVIRAVRLRSDPVRAADNSASPSAYHDPNGGCVPARRRRESLDSDGDRLPRRGRGRERPGLHRCAGGGSGRRGDDRRSAARGRRPLGRCVSLRPPAHPLRLLRGELGGSGTRSTRPARTRAITSGRRAARSATTSPRRRDGSSRAGRCGSSPDTSTSSQERTASACATSVTARSTTSWCVAGWSTRATSRRRCRPRTRQPFEVAVGRPRRARQRPAGRRRRIGLLLHRARVRQDGGRTRAPGSWTTTWSRTGSAGSGPGTPGSTTAAPIPAAGSRSAAIMDGHRARCRGRRPGRGHRRPVRAPRGFGAAGPHRPVAAGDDVSRHDAQRPRAAAPCGRSRTSSGSGASGASRADRIVLEQGEARTGPDVLHVDCTALGLRNAPATPIFQPGRIVLQQVRHNYRRRFNAALVGFVEAHRDDDAEKNRLCRPNPYASSIHDWPRMMSRTWRTERRWLSEPDVAAWLAESRLNLLRALPDHLAEPPVQMRSRNDF